MRPRGLTAVGTGVLCLLGALYLAESRQDAAVLEQANVEGIAGRYQAAARTSRRVRHSPHDARALALEAYALERLRRYPAASAAFERAVGRDPNNWALHRDWAVVLAHLGQRRQAAAEMRRALVLNPRMRLPAGFRRRPARPMATR